MFKAVTDYINGSIQELELVRWPTRQQAVRLSIVVFAFTLASSAAFGVVDFGLSSLVKFLLSLLFSTAAPSGVPAAVPPAL